jgi:hypothetical protein
MTKEQEKLQVRIREYKKSLDMVEPVKAIVKAFDGKCYNCRFGKAFADIGCYEDKSNYSDWITIRRRDGIYNDSAATIFSIRLSDMLDGKRINAEKIIANIDERVESRHKTIFRLEYELKSVEGVIEYLNQKITEINNIVGSLSCECIEAYSSKFEKLSYRLK